MYAIVSDSGRQFRVEEGMTFEVDRRDLPEDATSVEFDRVLLVGDIEDGPKIGQPVVDGAKVTATIVGEIQGDKIVVQKFRRRKGYARKTGHRQRYLQVKVEKIEH